MHINPKALLHTARRMPEADKMLSHFNALRELFEAALGLVIDSDEFDQRSLLSFTRNRDAHGLSMDPIAMAAIIESAARPKLNLTHPERLTLRAKIAEVNARLAEEARREIAGDRT